MGTFAQKLLLRVCERVATSDDVDFTCLDLRPYADLAMELNMLIYLHTTNH